MILFNTFSAKSKMVLAFFISSAYFTSPSQAQEISGALYSCKTQSISGFINSNGSWAPTNFSNKKTYTIGKRLFNGVESYVLYNTTTPSATFIMENTERSNPLYITFGGRSLDETFTLNKESLRYTNVSQVGYVTGHSGSSPFMEIGTCWKI